MADVEITRKKIIVVDSVGKNDYGDLIFNDKEGNDYKVSAKRRQYFDKIIELDAAVQLNYSSFKGREYVYSAVQVKDSLPEAKPETKQGAPQSKSSPVKPQGGSLGRDENKNRAFCLSYAKDWTIALLASPSFTKKESLNARAIIAVAKEFETYLDTGEVPESALVKEAKKIAKEV